MRASEIIRIIVFSLIGAALMFLVQPWIYQGGLVNLYVENLDAWLSNDYTTGASIVFFVSVLSTLLWYFLAAKAPAKRAEDVERWRLVWWLIFLFPVLSICVAIAFFRGPSNQPLLSLTALFVFDVLFLYWFITATSSPGGLNFVPPGAFLMRRLFRN